MIIEPASAETVSSNSDDAHLFRTRFTRVRDEVHKVLVGNDAVLDGVLMALIAGGHVLLEGVPGLGKTLLVKTLAQVLDLQFSRIQFTPDLMPADVTGTTLLVEDPDGGGRRFQFAPGPIFSNLVLADEINRATPKTQSALLEAMQEQNVTVSGTTHHLPTPFFVLATQNPIEMEGTYPLPEAQLDRFIFKLKFERPNVSDLTSIIQRTTSSPVPDLDAVLNGVDLIAMRNFARNVPIAPHVAAFAAQVIIATQPGPTAPETVNRYVRYGSSPRGAQALVLTAKIRALLDNRYSLAQEDIRAVSVPALRHRIVLNFEGVAEGLSSDTIVEDVIKYVAKQKFSEISRIILLLSPMRIQDFKVKMKRELGSSLENASPANVREFVDHIQLELWREEHPQSAPGERVGRINIPADKETSYEGMMRSFFVRALSANRDDSLIQLWVLALDLAYSGIEEMHAERMRSLFNGDEE